MSTILSAEKKPGAGEQPALFDRRIVNMSQRGELMSTILSAGKKPGAGEQPELFERRNAGYCQTGHHTLIHNHLFSPGTRPFWICQKCGLQTDDFLLQNTVSSYSLL